MSKHTPGPWLYGADECIDNETALAICEQNIDAHTKQSSGYFFVVYVGDGRRTALVGHGPDGEANARLIATAPELLDVLQRLCSIQESGDVASWASEWDDARAAIAKATNG